MDEVIDTLQEVKSEIEDLKREVRALASKQNTWGDLRLIHENVCARETSLSRVEELIRRIASDTEVIKSEVTK